MNMSTARRCARRDTYDAASTSWRRSSPTSPPSTARRPTERPNTPKWTCPTGTSFWGRFTPDGEAPHQRLLHVDDSSLRFDWQLDGAPTTVDIGLIARCDFTGVVLRGEMLIDADRLAVYESLTEPEHHVGGARRPIVGRLISSRAG
jgi:hypothetical protein